MQKFSTLKTAIALFAVAFLFLANSTNPPNGRTGAPLSGGGNEPVCASCHGGNSLGYDGTIDIVGMPATIQPSTTYPIQVQIERTVGDAHRAGFQLVILDDAAENAGTASNFGAKTTGTMLNGRTYIEHNSGARQFMGANDVVTYTFDWTSPANITGDNITVYSVAVLGNGSGTSNDYSFTNYPVFDFAAGNPPVAIQNVSTTDPLCNNDTNGSATVTASGGDGNYIYAWSSGGNGATENNLGAGSYTVTVTSEGTSVTENFTLANPAAINVTLVSNTDIDCNNSSATATVSAQGGTGNLDYAWDNGQNTQTATNLTAGNHTVTVTDANNCETVLNVFIDSDTTAPNAEAGTSASIGCDSGSIQLNGSGSATGANISYLWQTGNGNIVAGANTLTPTVNAAGTYTLTVTNNQNGCTSSDFVFVTENNDLPTAEAGTAQELNCNQSFINLDGSASSTGNEFSYQWTTNNGNIIADANTLNPTINAAGTYTLTVTNNNTGCESSDAVTVTEDTIIPLAEGGPAMSLTCDDNSTVLDGSSSSTGAQFTYQWTTNNGNIVNGANTLTPTVDAAGLYTLTITDMQNGCSSADNVQVDADTEAPFVVIVPPSEITCTDPMSLLDGSSSSAGAGILYNWTTNNGNFVGATNTAQAQAGSAGMYTLTVTNTNNGCETSSSVTVTADNNFPTATVENDALILDCAATNLNLSGTGSSTGGNFSYQWTTNAGNITGDPNSLTTTANDAGVYTLTVTNSQNGCTSQATVTVTDSPQPTVSIVNQNDLLCNGDNNGSVTVNAANGTGDYDYLWSTGEMTNSLSNLDGGTYTVTATDDNQCTATVSVLINEPAAITLSVTATGETASNANDGTATATAGGGTGNLTYAWSNGADTETVSNLAPGNYEVTVTDANDCEIVAGISISSFDCALTAEIATQTVDCNGAATGAASVTLQNAAAPITYAWSSGGDAAVENDLPAGNYTVTVNDGNNCEVVLTATVNEPTAITLAGTATDVSCNGESDGGLNVSVLGGTSPYTFDYPDGGNGTNLPAGSYLVTVFDSNGCTENTEITVAEPAALIVTASATQVSSEDANDGTASAGVQGGTSGYAFAWIGPNGYASTEQNISDLPAGEYCVTVTDTNGCTETACATVAVSGCASLAAPTDVSDVSCNGFSDGTASVTASGGSGTYTYAWSSGGTNAMESGLTAGIYTVTVDDGEGCTTVGTATVGQPSALTVQATEIINIECDGQTSGAATVQATGGTPNPNGVYTYVWSNGGTGATQMNLAAGNYSVTASDENDCETVFSLTIETGADDTPPVASALDIFVSLDGNGNAEITSDLIDNGSTDNCGIASYSLSQTEFTCADLGENDITLTVTDINGNANSTSATVTVQDTTAPEVVCPETFVVDCDGTVTYDFTAADNCGDVSLSFIEGTQSGSVFEAGDTDVVITATDVSGNAAECVFTVTVAEILTAEVSAQAVSCFGGNDGQITVIAAGGTAPYETEIEGGGDMISAGTYAVTITDAAGCEITTEATVTQPTAITVTVTQILNEQGDSGNGAIVIDSEGGTPGYTYAWTGPDNFTSEEEDLVNLSAGEYVLTVTDANGCTMTTETITVENITSTEEPIWAREVRIFPNPATEVLTVEMPTLLNNAVRFSFVNVTGQTVLTQVQQSNSLTRLDISDLATGLYLLKMQTEDEVLVRKVMVE